MRCTVQCIADYKVSRNDLIGIIVTTADIVFGQNWSTTSDQEKSDNTSELDNDTPRPDVLKRRRICNDLNYIFSSPRCIDMYLQDAAFLNLSMAADFILDKGDSAVTVGLDDTTKVAGHHMYNIKTDHISIINLNKQSRTVTTRVYRKC